MWRLHSGRMNSDQLPPELTTPDRSEPVWGAPQTPQRWGVKQTLTAVGVASVIAGLGGAAMYAASDSGSGTMAGGMHGGFGPGGMPAGPGGMAGGPGGMAGVSGPRPDAVDPASLHGEFVVSDGKGGYTTVLTQTGTVTAITEVSITVRSDDGYGQTYVIPPTASGADRSFAVNDPVTIRATRTDQTATVTNIDNPSLGVPGGPHR